MIDVETDTTSGVRRGYTVYDRDVVYVQAHTRVVGITLWQSYPVFGVRFPRHKGIVQTLTRGGAVWSGRKKIFLLFTNPRGKLLKVMRDLVAAGFFVTPLAQRYLRSLGLADSLFVTAKQDVVLPPQVFPEGLSLMPFQQEGVSFIAKHRKVILGDQMGCVSGDALLDICWHTKRKTVRKTVTLQDAYLRFNHLSRDKRRWWSNQRETHCRVLAYGNPNFHPIRRILKKGEKTTVRVVLADDRELRLTADHEVLTPEGWVPAGELSVFQTVITDTGWAIVAKILNGGPADVYDVVMHDPHRNFIANGFVVHNCGKTITALAAVAALQAFPALLVVPPSLGLNWEREAQKWLPARSIGLLRKRKDEPPDTDLVIAPYSLMELEYAKKKNGKPNRKVFSPKNVTLALLRKNQNPSTRFKSLIVDESHYCKNPDAMRTKAVNMVAEEIDVRVLLTGTPIVNRPDELLSQIQILGRLKEWGNKTRYRWAYCGEVYDKKAVSKYRKDSRVGTKDDLQELHKRLVVGTPFQHPTMLRRLKKDVMKDLPPKQRSRIVVEITNRKEYERAQKEFLSWLRDKKGVEAAMRASGAEALVKINYLRQLAAIGKIEAAKEWLADFFNSVGFDRKLIVFAHFREVQTELLVAFPECAVITGGQSREQRDENVKNFVSPMGPRGIIASILAGGVGLTLHADGRCQDVAFMEYPWTPGDLCQAEDRVHRKGSKGERIMCWRFVAANTIDEIMEKILAQKQEVLNATLDGDSAAAGVSILGETMKAMVKQDKVKQDKVKQDKVKQDKVKQDKVKQDKVKK